MGKGDGIDAVALVGELLIVGIGGIPYIGCRADLGAHDIIGHIRTTCLGKGDGLGGVNPLDVKGAGNCVFHIAGFSKCGSEDAAEVGGGDACLEIAKLFGPAGGSHSELARGGDGEVFQLIYAVADLGHLVGVVEAHALVVKTGNKPFDFAASCAFNGDSYLGSRCRSVDIG